MSQKKVYKILSIDDWEKSKKTGLIKTAVDQQDGFIHFSNANQLAASLEFYFAGHEEVVLLLPKMSKIKSKLKYETAGANSKRKGVFAHLYADLKIEDIETSWKIRREALRLPESILLEAESSI